MAYKTINVIIMDDSKLDCFIAEKIFKSTRKFGKVCSFQKASEALEVMGKTVSEEGTKNLLLVDIQMPVMNGFEFVEAFNKLPDHIKNEYVVVLINSSEKEITPTQLNNVPTVKQLLTKPLNFRALEELVYTVQRN